MLLGPLFSFQSAFYRFICTFGLDSLRLPELVYVLQGMENLPNGRCLGDR